MTNVPKVDFKRWDEEMDKNNSDKHKLYDELCIALQSGDDIEILWRLSRVSIYLSKEALNKEYLKNKVTEALSYADKACLMDPKNFNCHKWYCASAGKMSALVGSKERIRYGHEFKEHADIAMKLNPNDWYMLLMFGRWCYDVASLSWFERKFASSVFGTPPVATLDEALQYFTKSDQLHPQSKETYLWISKTLLAQKKYSEAKKMDRKWNKIE